MRFSIRLIAVAAVLATLACSRESPDDTDSEAVVPVTTAEAVLDDVTPTLHAAGLVTAAPGAALSVVAPEPARIAEMPRAEGDLVRRGDLLVRFDIPSSAAEASKQQAEIGRARARIANAQAADARMRDLFERGVASRKEVQEAEREVADAQADFASAEASAAAATALAARSVVVASFDGIVANRSHNPGDLVDSSGGDVVLRVVDPRRLQFVAQIPLPDLPRIRIGAEAHVAGPSGDAPRAALTVASGPAAVQEGTATVPVRLAFTSVPPYPVGTPLEVDIDAETQRQVVLVPVAAVVHEGEEAAVFVAADGKARRRVVTLGAQGLDRVEVRSGVKAGEAVIVSNQNGLPDGAAISVAPR